MIIQNRYSTQSDSSHKTLNPLKHQQSEPLKTELPYLIRLPQPVCFYIGVPQSWGSLSNGGADSLA